MMASNKGFEEFLPVYQCRRRWSDRLKEVEFPLFPGYVFCRLNPQYRLPLLTIPGVLHFVGIGKTPVPLEDAEITAIQAAVRSGLSTEPWPFLSSIRYRTTSRISSLHSVPCSSGILSLSR